MEKRTILSARNLTKIYGASTVLDSVSIDFREGEIHALLGENGAGKSTFCKILAGAITPDDGQVVIDGTTVGALTPIKAKEAGIGMVYQEFNLVPELSIYENLFLGKELRRGILVDTKAMMRHSRELFAEMGIQVDVTAKIKDISVAYCQLVEIAKALLENSKLLILDEPTAPLTNPEIEILFQVLLKLKGDGISMIYISHRLEEVFVMCDRITVLRDGQYICTKDVADTGKEELIALMIGRELSQEFPPREAVFDYENAETVLSVEGLRNHKLKDVSFQLKKGEILGLAGLVGAGRTETVRAIFGADRLEAGTVRIRGKQVKIQTPMQAIRHGLALIPEDRKREGLMLEQSIGSNMSIVVIKELSRMLVVSQGAEKRLHQDRIRQLNIKLGSVGNPVSSLSGGNQQKIVLAKWLSTSADILIFDEPTRGIDVGAKKEIYDFLFQLKAAGSSVIVISSEMSEILNLSDRIVVMYEGSVQGELLYGEATQDKVLRMASGLDIGDVS